MTSASRILVVEDSPTQLLQMQMLLESAGYSVVTAADGQEAIEVIPSSKFDLIVTDLEMPRLDGLGLVRAISAQDIDIPVIVTTATGSELIAAETLHAGAASYVPKDGIVSLLVPTIARILELKQAAQPDPRLALCVHCVQVEWKLNNDLLLVPSLIRRVGSILSELGIRDPSARLQVAMALDEALVNAMVHGNLEVSSELRRTDNGRPYTQAIQERRALVPYCDRRVTFSLQADRSTATFTICDQGPGFQVAEVADPTDPANLEKEGGRGLLLINTFMDKVTHNDCGNKIVMIKHYDERD
jgi:CheY-like chemotaxis protein/anti-sigma regulatory factor (Ser/Thr protein kinase)